MSLSVPASVLKQVNHQQPRLRGVDGVRRGPVMDGSMVLRSQSKIAGTIRRDHIVYDLASEEQNRLRQSPIGAATGGGTSIASGTTGSVDQDATSLVRSVLEGPQGCAPQAYRGGSCAAKTRNRTCTAGRSAPSPWTALARLRYLGARAILLLNGHLRPRFSRLRLS
jgi:hypothetical protein